MIEFNKNNFISKILSLNIKSKLLVIFTALILTAVSIVGYYGFISTKNAYMKNAYYNGSEQVSDYAIRVNEKFLNIPIDKEMINQLDSVKKFIYWNSVGDTIEAGRHKISIEKSLLSFMAAKKNYFKIRFIDKNGQELIKVMYDKNRYKSYVDNAANLQNKSKRDYFVKGMLLKEGERNISDVGLNKENGVVTKPYTTVLRIVYPLIDTKGARHGIYVVSMYAHDLFGTVDEGMDVLVANKQGEYIHNIDDTKELGASERKSTLENDDKELFDTISSSKEEYGKIERDDEIISYKKFYLSKEMNNYISFIYKAKKSDILADLDDFVYMFILIFAIVLVVTLVIMVLFIKYLVSPLTKINKNLELMSKGDLACSKIEYIWNDETGDIIRSLEKLIDNSKATIEQADIVSNGDYSRRIRLLSENDKLGKSLNNMTESLQLNYEKNEKENWIKDGIGSLIKEMSGDKTLQELSSAGLNFISSYLYVGKAALYIFDKERDELRLNAGYAFTKRDALSNTYGMGEGVVGQVALEKSPILLRGVPENTNMNIQTGTTDIQPLNIYTLPLLHDNNLNGVIELASHTAFGELAEAFLNEACILLAAALNNAQQNDEVKSLLKLSDAKNEEIKYFLTLSEEAQAELEERSEELEKANAHMQQQQVELEEANAQLEEQQQQLKISEIELKDKNINLEKSKEELDFRAKEIERASEYKSEFLANMSHELRTPLNAIILLSSLLEKNKKKNLDADDIKKVSTINRSGDELLRLIGDILDLSKVESGQMDIVVDKFESSVFLEEMDDLFEHTAKDKSIYFKVIDAYKGSMQTDRNRLAQIVRNLLSNSFKFTKTGGITLKLAKSKDESKPISLTVSDTGIGIPKEKQNQIFEAFKQVDGSTSREYGGTGLGLSISKELAHLLGGDIYLESKENEGSSFTVILPNLQLHENTGEVSKTGSSRPNAVTDITESRKTLLVIEDDKDFAEILKERIEALNINVLVAGNAKDGLVIAQEHKPSGIVLDLGLPDMDGIDLMRELKSHISLRNIPVHVLSGRDKDTQIMHSGIIGYSQKPVDENDINALVERITAYATKRVKDLLIVEDNEAQREAMIEWIGNGTIKSHGVGSATEAISEIKRDIYDTVIVDLGLSKGSGYEVCDFIAKNCPELPIIIYTGKELSKKETNALKKYTDSIILKTVNSKDRLVDEVDVFLHKIREENIYGTLAADKDLNVSLKDINVLIVDDDIKNIFVLDTAISEYDGASIHASNGQEALDILAENKDIDVILMDVMMPVMNGYDATRAIKEDKNLKDIPVITVTAKAMEEDRQKCIEAGADEHITKPIDVKKLVSTIRSLVDKK